MTVQVAIVGGGLSGLFTAAALVSEGVDDVVVLERSVTPGGVAATISRDGYLLEPAVGTVLLPHPHLSPLLHRVGASLDPVETSVRLVYTGERLVEVPPSPKALLTPIMPVVAKLRLAAEPLIRRRSQVDDESLDGFLTRRLGSDAGARLAWLAASGVYAGDPARLSARSSFRDLHALEDEAGSIVGGAVHRLRNRPKGAPRPYGHVPRGGMAKLASSAARWLGARYRGGFTVIAVRRDGAGWVVEGDETIRAGRVVLACRPGQAADLVGGALAATLRQEAAAPVVVAAFGGPVPEMTVPDALGALTGRDSGLVTRGVLFESSYARERAPEGHALVRVIAGGAGRRDIVGWDDDRIAGHLRDEVATMLRQDLRPTFVHVVRHSPGIPQYEVGHDRWLSEISALTPPGLALAGWGYRGVGITHLATDAVAVAASLSSAGSA